MDKQQLVADIRQRFRFTAGDIKKGLAGYEMELIYQVYPKLSKAYLDSVIEDFRAGKIKAQNRGGNTVKSTRTTKKNKGVKDASVCF